MRRKDVSVLARQLVDAVDVMRREMALQDGKVQQQADEIERLRALIRSYADARDGITLNWSTDRKGRWHLFDAADEALLVEARRG